MSHNSESLIHWHLRTVVQRLEVLLLSMKQAVLTDMYKKASENDCTATDEVTADRWFPTPSTAPGVKTPADIEPDDPESADEVEIQMEYCYD